VLYPDVTPDIAAQVVISHPEPAVDGDRAPAATTEA
jgi:hypothetical protein